MSILPLRLRRHERYLAQADRLIEVRHDDCAATGQIIGRGLAPLAAISDACGTLGYKDCQGPGSEGFECHKAVPASGSLCSLPRYSVVQICVTGRMNLFIPNETGILVAGEDNVGEMVGVPMPGSRHSLLFLVLKRRRDASNAVKVRYPCKPGVAVCGTSAHQPSRF